MLVLINFNLIFYAIFFDAKEFILKNKNSLLNSILFFKWSLLFKLNYLTDISCVDFIDCKKRFKINYILHSYFYKNKFTFFLAIFFLEKISSFLNIFNSSIWLEREIFDMFGLLFYNNPDLRRILTDYTFFGHPLKKDFPLSGYFELFFSEKYYLIQEKVCELMQEYRFFQASSLIEEWDMLNLNFKN